jgi:hypothetical protein
VKLGVKTGFDSGTTLDYVYRDQAEGFTALGRLIDRNYLDAIGWRGIRLRKTHLEKLLHRAMTELRVADKSGPHRRYRRRSRSLRAGRRARASRYSRHRPVAGFQRLPTWKRGGD